jgi:hypothetical protein
MLRSAFDTAKGDATLREGDWMIAGQDDARVSVGGHMLDASGKKTSGVSGASYSKTSGMLPSVGEKADDRGVPGWCDMSVVDFSFGICCPFRGGGEGRTVFCLGARGERGMEAVGVEGQSGTEKRLNIEPVCFADP